MNDLKDLVLSQQRELAQRQSEFFVARDTLTPVFTDNLVRVIIGPRRAGKSFFAVHWLQKLGKFGYLNFDDEKLAGAKDLNELLSAVDSLYDSPEFILLDEIQNVKNWELWVNRLQRQGRRLLVSGSNSKLLSRELATHLTGRHLPVHIFPFSFKEFVAAQNKELTSAETRELLFQYATNGGYPEPLVKKLNYKDYLSTLFNSIVYKDIVRRYRIRRPQVIEDLAQYLLSNIAKEYSFNTLAKVAHSKSVHTAQKYLQYLEEAFIFFSIRRFSFKTKQQALENKKIYCIDNGFIQAKGFKTAQDTGRLYENLAAVKLKKAEMENKLDFFYWKNPQQEEVDFVIKKGLKTEQLIQICSDVSALETKKREVRALLKAGQELNCKNLLVLTTDYEAAEKAEWYGIKGEIRYQPIWKWLLEAN